MNIISHKNNRYNNEDFFTKAYTDGNIDGVVLDVTKTSNGKIVVFESPTSTVTEINSIQNNTLEQIKSSEIKPLERFLSNMAEFKKRILINVLPLDLPYLSESTVADIVKINTDYINEIFDVINKFPDLTICVFSCNQILITLIKNSKKPCNLGWLINQAGASYMDLEIYIFQSYMLNEKVLLQQLDNKKEIMAYTTDSDSINSFMNFFKDTDKNEFRKRIFDNISVITYYPDIFINSYKDK